MRQASRSVWYGDGGGANDLLPPHLLTPQLQVEPLSSSDGAPPPLQFAPGQVQLLLHADHGSGGSGGTAGSSSGHSAGPVMLQRRWLGLALTLLDEYCLVGDAAAHGSPSVPGVAARAMTLALPVPPTATAPGAPSARSVADGLGRALLPHLFRALTNTHDAVRGLVASMLQVCRIGRLGGRLVEPTLPFPPLRSPS